MRGTSTLVIGALLITLPFETSEGGTRIVRSPTGLNDNSELTIDRSRLLGIAPQLLSDDGVIPGLRNLDLLVAYDLATGLSKNAKCVKYRKKIPSPIPHPAQQIAFDLDQGSTFEQLFTKQNLSVMASFGYGAWNGDASYNFMRLSGLSRFSEYLRVSVNVENERQLLDIDEVRFSDYGSAARRAGPDKFRERCGDAFVLGKIQGGELSVLYNASASDKTEQERARATLNAAYSAIRSNATVGATVENELQAMSKEGRIRINILRRGPNDQLADLAVLETIKYALDYNVRVKSNAWTTAYIVSTYDAVPDSPRLDPIQPPDIEQSGRSIRSLYQRLAGLDYMIKNPRQFGAFSLDRAEQEKQQLASQIETYRRQVTGCLAARRRAKARQEPCAEMLDSRIKADVPQRPEITILNPVSPAWIGAATAVGSDVWVVENRGSWYRGPQPESVQAPTSTSNVWKFENRKSGKTHQVAFERPMKLPPDSIAYFHISDHPTTDNRQEPSDQARLVVYRPLYADEHSYPQRWDPAGWTK